MTGVHDELQRLIELNHNEQWVPHHLAVEQLEDFGDDLIPGLVDCLSDEDSEIRQLAVDLLAELRPRSNSAVPDLIQRLDDEDRLVRSSALFHLNDFGPLAVGAIPHLDRWLEDEDDEYLRTLALTSILTLDPERTELLSDLRAALTSGTSMVRHLAQRYFSQTKTQLPFDESMFRQAVRDNWHFQTPSHQVFWQSELQEDGTWCLDLAPVFQELLGGAHDGKIVWPGFQFDLSGFGSEPGVELKSYGAQNGTHDGVFIPLIGMSGEYFGQPFFLRIFFEPRPDSQIREGVDVHREKVRPVNEEETDDLPF